MNTLDETLNKALAEEVAQLKTELEHDTRIISDLTAQVLDLEERYSAAIKVRDEAVAETVQLAVTLGREGERLERSMKTVENLSCSLQTALEGGWRQ